MHVCSVRHIGLRGDFHEAVTIATIHTELCHVNIVRKRHRLGWLVSDFGVFRRGVIPRGSGQAAQAITIAQTTILIGIQFVQRGKKLAMVLDGLRARRSAAAKFATADSSRGELPIDENCAQDVLRSDAAKWLRLIVSPESNEDSINARPEGKTKFLFLILVPVAR